MFENTKEIYRKLSPFYLRDLVGTTLVEKAILPYCLAVQSNRIGVFNFSVGRAAEDLETLPQTFQEGFANVLRLTGWEFDSTSRVLYIPTWWKFHTPENHNVIIGNLKDLRSVNKSELVDKFMNNLEFIPETFHQTFVGTLLKLYPERCPKRLRERYHKPSANQEQEQEQYKEKEKTPQPPQAGALFLVDASRSDDESVSRTIESDADSDNINTKVQASGVVESASESGSVGLTAKPKKRRASKYEKFNRESVYADPRFQGFLSRYPKPDGKLEAARSWWKLDIAGELTPEVVAEIYAAVERQSKTKWQKDNFKYVPDASKWLNQRRWEDGGPRRVATVPTTPVAPVQSETEDTTPREIVPCPPELIAAFHGVGLGFLTETENAGGVL